MDFTLRAQFQCGSGYVLFFSGQIICGMIFQDCWNMIVCPKWHFISVFPYFSLNWAVCEPVKMRTMWFEFWSHPVHALVEGAMCTGWSALAGTDAPVYLSITGCRPDGCNVWWWTSCRTPALSPRLPTLVTCSEWVGSGDKYGWEL